MKEDFEQHYKIAIQAIKLLSQALNDVNNGRDANPNIIAATALIRLLPDKD